ncbi:hypothetical protein NC651_023415 [Populus alba x Populus x berolinensis]|nr:hypothetical protein NC651_023415 [Populus alba x Populus x berolinensis]
MGEMGKNVLLLCFILLLFLGGVTSAPTATSPAKIVSGVFSNVVPAFMKWLWSMKATTKTGWISDYTATFAPFVLFCVFSCWFWAHGTFGGSDLWSSNEKFESGYTVETVFDGSKLGIEPYSVEVLPSGELLILDSVNSNIYRMSSSLSLYSRPKLVAGSHEGYSGHVDGKLREAKMNHPKGLTVDDRGNIYIADTMNMAIRKISDAGIAELLAAGFFGYMLALLQRRVGMIVSPQNVAMETSTTGNPYQTPIKSFRPPLIPTEDEQEKHEEGLFGSLGKLFINTWASIAEILGGIVPSFRKKPPSYQYQSYQQQSTSWPLQDSFVIPDEDEPPSTETRTPTPSKTYPFMSKNTEKMHQWRQGRSIYSGWDGDFQQQQQQQQHHQPQQQHHQQQQKQQHHHRYQSSTPHTYYEQSYEKTNEIVFGAVQEQDVKHGTTPIRVQILQLHVHGQSSPAHIAKVDEEEETRILIFLNYILRQFSNFMFMASIVKILIVCSPTSMLRLLSVLN